LLEVNQAITDLRSILAASGISKSDAQTIVNDLKAIAAEAQKNAQEAKGKAQGQKERFKKN